MAKPLFRPFPGPPPYPRLPAKWDEKTNRKWSSDLLRVLDQQVNPLVTVVTSASTTYSVQTTSSDVVVVANGVAPFTVTLPPVSSMVNHTVTVKVVNATVTVDGDGANIDGSPTMTVPAPNAMKIVSDGTDWWIV